MKSLICVAIVAVALIFAGSAFAAPIYCPLNGHSYEAFGGTFDWNVASANAVANGGYLATLTDENENEWVWSHLGNVSYYWIGGIQDPDGVEPASGWGWVTGEAWDYTNWNGGEPNDSSFYGYNDDNIQLWTNGKWNDINGDSSNALYGTDSQSGNAYYQGYIVEYSGSVVPEPASMALFGIGLAGLLKLRRKK